MTAGRSRLGLEESMKCPLLPLLGRCNTLHARERYLSTFSFALALAPAAAADGTTTAAAAATVCFHIIRNLETMHD